MVEDCQRKSESYPTIDININILSKKLFLKSVDALQFVKSDLQEFTSTVQRDTVKAANTVKEKISVNQFLNLYRKICYVKQ